MSTFRVQLLTFWSCIVPIVGAKPRRTSVTRSNGHSDPDQDRRLIDDLQGWHWLTNEPGV